MGVQSGKPARNHCKELDRDYWSHKAIVHTQISGGTVVLRALHCFNKKYYYEKQQSRKGNDWKAFQLTEVMLEKQRENEERPKYNGKWANEGPILIRQYRDCHVANDNEICNDRPYNRNNDQ